MIFEGNNSILSVTYLLSNIQKNQTGLYNT